MDGCHGEDPLGEADVEGAHADVRGVDAVRRHRQRGCAASGRHEGQRRAAGEQPVRQGEDVQRRAVVDRVDGLRRAPVQGSGAVAEPGHEGDEDDVEPDRLDAVFVLGHPHAIVGNDRVGGHVDFCGIEDGLLAQSTSLLQIGPSYERNNR